MRRASLKLRKKRRKIERGTQTRFLAQEAQAIEGIDSEWEFRVGTAGVKRGLGI